MNARVIETIKRVLEAAEAGKISSVAIATVAPDLSTGSTFTLGDGTLAELLGSIDLTKHRIMRQSEDGPLD